jgi:methylmalonyl-CoA mutase N-terminal domain/subunit
VKRTLAAVRAAAAQQRNVMPAVIDAVEVYATVGEICGVLKEVFGAYREPVRF